MSSLARLTTAAALLAAPSIARAQTVSPDSLLAAACAGGAGMADGLLLVEFRPDVDEPRRVAMAKEAGASFSSNGAPNEAYAVLPPGSRTDLAADRLIRLDGVQSVGEVVCPAPAAPAQATASPDTTARPDSAARPPAADTARTPASPGDTARRATPSGTLPESPTPGTPGTAAPADTTTPPPPADSIAPTSGPT